MRSNEGRNSSTVGNTDYSTSSKHQHDPPEVLTVEEAAALLRVNHKTLREAIRRNEVPGVVRLGRAIRLSRSTLLEWFRAGAVLRSQE